MTIEFALTSLFLFAMTLTGLDLAGFYIQRSNLRAAVSAAAVSAFATRDAANYAGLVSYVQRASRAPDPSGVTVTTGCNGGTSNCTNTGRTCSCLSTTGTYVAAASCTATCSGGATSGSTAGYYLNIQARYIYTPLILPRGLMGNTAIAEAVTVRLQ
ncbi:MAG: hypothetical protein ACOY45_06220 [Pseudomonadota bacterium]